MTKDELIWIIIRTVGVIFLTLFIIALPDVISGAFYYLFLHDEGVDTLSQIKDQDRVVYESMAHGMKNHLTDSISRIFIYLGAAWYLLNRGEFVFRLISKQKAM